MHFTQHTDSLPLGQVTQGNTTWLFSGLRLTVTVLAQTSELADSGGWVCILRQ